MEQEQKKPDFPRLPYNLNRNRKIMDYENAVIKKQYAEGRTIASLAREYKVVWTTIKKHVDENYRKDMVARDVEARKVWYKNLTELEKKKLQKYTNKIYSENKKRFEPQRKYAAYFTNKNHKKPEIYKRRMQRQNIYVHKPKIKQKILQRQRTAYKENSERKEYHKIYDRDWKATHKLIDGKWVLIDRLKWRILREMVIR